MNKLTFSKLSLCMAALVLLAVFSLAGCGGGGGSNAGDNSSANAATAVINQSGGAITLTDGTTVTFAAGIVKDGTSVTVSSTAQPTLVPTQEVQALSPTIVIDVAPDFLLPSAPADSVMTIEFPLTGNTTQSLAAGLSKATAAGVLGAVNDVVQVVVESAGIAGEIATYYGPLILKSPGKGIVSLGMDKLCKAALGGSVCTVAKVTVGAKNSIKCTQQSTSLYQVDFLNGIPVFDTNIRRNGKPPLILVHGWQELGIIGMSCDKPYSSTWKVFLKEYSLDPAILDKFQVFSLAYSTSNPVFGGEVDGVVGSDFARIIGSQFGHETVYVVAHSMGGLVARSALVNHGANIGGLVTLATPHHGTPVASQEGVDLFGGTLLYPLIDYVIGGQGIMDLAWDNFDGHLQPPYHDRRGNVGNPPLEALNIQDSYRGRYVVFVGVDNEPIIGAIIKNLGYENDAVVPISSALLYNSGNAIDSRMKLQKHFDGLSHFSITSDVGVLSETRAALLGYLYDTTPPIVSSTSPANSTTNVPVNTAITATFSEAMDSSTMNTATFMLSNGSSNVAGTLTYSGTTATFTPYSNLAYSTTYTTTITTGVRDSAGYSMANNYSWTFTTASAPGSAPPAPTGISATASNGQAIISWSSVSGATSYNVYWSTISGITKNTGTIISNVTSPYTHTGRTNGTTYYYVVTAVNSYGESAESSQVSATPQGTGTLQGVVKDAVSGSAISGVTINVYDSSNSLATSKTTDSSGLYTATLTVGTYSLTIAKTGYISETVSNITIQDNVATTVETVLQISTVYSGTGNISGTIRNALNSAGVSGVALNFRSGINTMTGTIVATATTGTSGTYTVSGLNTGNYTGEATISGYTTAYFTVTVIGGQTKSGQDATITPVLSAGETRIILTWGATPSDLDSHLTGPITGSTSRFHIYYSNRGSSATSPYAGLDRDDTSSYGPETTTIYQQFTGTYRFSVYNFSNGGSTSSTILSNSSAKVKVYRGSNLVATFNVPPTIGGTLWTVFEISGDTITPVNTMSYVSGSTGVQSPALRSATTRVSHSDAPLMMNLPMK